jgi:uncharacterized protein
MTETTAPFAFEWRGLNADQRIVGGIAVPYGQVSYVTGNPRGEMFLPGSVTRSVGKRKDTLKLFMDHDHKSPIGTLLRHDARRDDGLWTEWRIAETPPGDAALVQILAGMYDSFSVGFRTIKDGFGGDGAREIREADILEISLVALGAYEGARVTELRSPAPLGPADLTAWINAHPVPSVDRRPLPDLHRFTRRPTL